MSRHFILIFAYGFCALAFGQGKKLKIEQATLSQMEDGIPTAVDAHFLPGETVYFSCRVSGFAKEGDEPPRIRLSYEVEVRDSKGVLLETPALGKVHAELAPEDKEWQPKIRQALAIPPLADSGKYTVTARVKDEHGKTEAQASIAFAVDGRDVPASDTLVERNFRFLRSEDDRDPLVIAAYRPGDTLWARFDMTGYKLGEKNGFDIEYGLTVLRPGGGVTYQQPRAAAEKNESFYRQRYTPGILSLTLPKDVAKGAYTIVLAIRDNLGGQTFESRKVFSVE